MAYQYTADMYVLQLYLFKNKIVPKDKKARQYLNDSNMVFFKYKKPKNITIGTDEDDGVQLSVDPLFTNFKDNVIFELKFNGVYPNYISTIISNHGEEGNDDDKALLLIDGKYIDFDLTEEAFPSQSEMVVYLQLDSLSIANDKLHYSNKMIWINVNRNLKENNTVDVKNHFKNLMSGTSKASSSSVCPPINEEIIEEPFHESEDDDET